jgi:hypothetical protein
MTLKDASAYNIQFLNNKPILIDSLSFEKYQEGKPWIAYAQFCRHFLAPLAVMAHTDIRLQHLLRIHIDGIPLDLASSLLPVKTRFLFSLLTHVHFQSKAQKFFRPESREGESRITISKFRQLALVDSLRTAVSKLNWKPSGTTWADYYEDTNYTSRAMIHKQLLVAGFLEKSGAKVIWDLGANTGMFSRIAADKGSTCISFDMDPGAVEKNYLECKRLGEDKILPLLLDLTNPSASLGWANEERMSLEERGPAELAMALALIHHLAISNNLPFERIAEYLSRICEYLIIEFVPKSDSKAQQLLASRNDIFTDYTLENFERVFQHLFDIEERQSIEDSERFLYLMKRRQL